DPIAQLPEAFPILVAHNNQTRVGVLGDVRGFLGVAINLDHAAGGRPSSPEETGRLCRMKRRREFIKLLGASYSINRPGLLSLYGAQFASSNVSLKKYAIALIFNLRPLVSNHDNLNRATCF